MRPRLLPVYYCLAGPVVLVKAYRKRIAQRRCWKESRRAAS